VQCSSDSTLTGAAESTLPFNPHRFVGANRPCIGKRSKMKGALLALLAVASIAAITGPTAGAEAPAGESPQHNNPNLHVLLG
jgi:hypothetical protein